MNNEQLLLSLYKQQQYDQTRTKLQKIFMVLTAAASASGIIITSVFYTDWVLVYIYSGMLCSVFVNVFLVRQKRINYNIASLFAMIFAGFVLVPVLWLKTGINGSAPFVSLVILVSILILFSGKLLQWLTGCFLFVVLGLTITTSITAISTSEDIASLVYIISAYAVAVALIVLYMVSKQREFTELNDRFLRSSFRDELTRLYNRKLLDLMIEHEEKLYIKEKIDYVFIMFDVDNFKSLNDTHGHVYGDIVLRSVSQCILENARASDFVVRYGGDEFLVVQANASDVSIKTFTDRIDKAMETSCQLDTHITVSYGIAVRSECDSPEATLKLADERLYENKQARKAAAAAKTPAVPKKVTTAKKPTVPRKKAAARRPKAAGTADTAAE